MTTYLLSAAQQQQQQQHPPSPHHAHSNLYSSAYLKNMEEEPPRAPPSPPPPSEPGPSSSKRKKDSSGAASSKPNNLISATEKCRVCREPAAKHVHYGANTCFSCRAFFRRSIQNRTCNNYNCRRQGKCEITLKSRKNCQKCRFERCLEVGMKPSWVLSEEERSRSESKKKQQLWRSSES